jgi:hypothetical protein
MYIYFKENKIKRTLLFNWADSLAARWLGGLGNWLHI